MRRPQLLIDAGDYSLDIESAYGTGLRLSELADALSHDCDVRVFAPGTVAPLPLGSAELVTDQAKWDCLLRSSHIALFTDLADESRLMQAAAAGLSIVTENAPPIEHLEYPSLLASKDPVRAHQDMVRTYVRQLRLRATSSAGHRSRRSPSSPTCASRAGSPRPTSQLPALWTI